MMGLEGVAAALLDTGFGFVLGAFIFRALKETDLFCGRSVFAVRVLVELLVGLFMFFKGGAIRSL